MKGKSESEIVHTHRVSDDKDKDIASVISVQCVINSEEGQAGIADTLVFFIFIFFVISGVCNEQLDQVYCA